jgi:hypothetical protein
MLTRPFRQTGQEYKHLGIDYAAGLETVQQSSTVDKASLGHLLAHHSFISVMSHRQPRPLSKRWCCLLCHDGFDSH